MTFTLSNDDIKRCRAIALGNRDLIMDIVRAVCAEADVPINAVLGESRKRSLSHTRWLISFLAYEQGHTIEAIGRVLRKDHSSILHGIKRERERREGEGEVIHMEGPVDGDILG